MHFFSPATHRLPGCEVSPTPLYALSVFLPTCDVTVHVIMPPVFSWGAYLFFFLLSVLSLSLNVYSCLPDFFSLKVLSLSFSVSFSPSLSVFFPLDEYLCDPASFSLLCRPTVPFQYCTLCRCVAVFVCFGLVA